MNDHRRRGSLTAAATLTVTGALFAVYPALRPYTDETTLAGAAAFASTAWVAAHTAGIFAFILLAYGVRAATDDLGTRSARAAALLTGLGGSLVLPYYGAEAFGLQVIGARAVADGDASLLELADAFRYGPLPMTMFGAGLVLLGAAGVLLAISLWPSTVTRRLAGLLIGLGLIAYLPQFFGAPGVRIAHGIVLGLGCALLALALLRGRPAAQV